MYIHLEKYFASKLGPQKSSFIFIAQLRPVSKDSNLGVQAMFDQRLWKSVQEHL